MAGERVTFDWIHGNVERHESPRVVERPSACRTEARPEALRRPSLNPRGLVVVSVGSEPVDAHALQSPSREERV